MNEPIYEKVSLWDELKNEKRPLFLYGTGNGADKILNVLYSKNIFPEGIFASDGFVRDRTFRDYKVLSYSGVTEKYGNDIVILLCFGTNRPEVTDFIEHINSKHTLRIPDVPLYGGDIFDKEYFEKNKKNILTVRNMLSDEISKEFYDAAVNFRLTGKYKYLSPTEEPSKTLSSLLNTNSVEYIADLGAYKGDTAKLFLETFANAEKIYAVEPDPKTFKKLSEFSAAVNTSQKNVLLPFNFAASDKNETLVYHSSASRGAGTAGKNRRSKEIPMIAKTLDSLNLEHADLIKYDVEGDESAALDGSLQTIKRCIPSISVSLYHKTDDLFYLPLKIAEILKKTTGSYTFHLRRPPCIPAWDITFYAVNHKT